MGIINYKHQKISQNKVFTKRILLALMLTVASVLSILYQAAPVFAVGSMYLIPTNGSVARDGLITISFRINPSTPVTVVEGTIGFNTAALQFVGIDSSGSPFDASVQQTVSAGSIKISRAKLDSAGVGSDALIANITFKALSYSGSSPVSLTAANAAYDGSYTNPSASGATVNFTPGVCPAGQTGTPPTCAVASTGGGGSSNPSATPKTTPANPAQTTPAATTAAQSALETPVISNKTNQYTTFGITVTTNISAQVQLVYGVSRDALNIQTNVTASGISHALSVSEGLTPGSQVFYKVVASDGKSTKESNIQSVSLKGISVKVALLDKNMKAITNQTVALVPSDTEATSGSNGVVVFDGLSPRDYTVQMQKDGKTYQQHITVQSNIVTSNGTQTSAQQLQAVIFDSYEAATLGFPLWAWYVGGGIVVLGALGLIGYRSWRYNGIIRNWYARMSDYKITKELKDVAVGDFTPVSGSSATPHSAIGSKSPVDTVNISNSFDNQGGARND